jgi:hypothetical protein
MDPFQGVAKLVVGLIQAHRLDQWCKLCFTLFFSSCTTFLFTCGGSLVAHRPTAESVGSGMVMAAVVCGGLYRRSDLIKGMTVVMPGAEAAEEIASDLQTVTRK